MLCRRCEHRAAYYDTKRAPRCECKDTDRSVYSCYCYEPTRPAVMERLPGDERPEFGGYAGCRMRAIRPATELVGAVVDLEDGKAVVWQKP